MKTPDTSLLLKNIKTAVSGRTFKLKREQKQLYSHPLEDALPALICIAGGSKEATGYFHSISKDAVTFKQAVKGTFYNTAYQIFQHHPKISSYALNHPALKKKLNSGPFERLSYTDKVSRALGLLIIDLKNLLWLKQKGYLSWDDGTYEATLAIAYGWRRALPDKLKLSQSQNDVHFETRKYLKELAVQYPRQDLIRFVIERYQMSWYYKNTNQLNKSLHFFNELEQNKAQDESSELLRLLGLSSMADMALRYKQTDMLDETLKKLELQIPEKTIKESSALLWAKTQMLLQKGDTIEAKKLNDKLYRYGEADFKVESALNYKKMGQSKKAETILNKLKNN